MRARDRVSWQLRKCVLACKRCVMHVQVAHAGNKRALSRLVHVFATMRTWGVCVVACNLGDRCGSHPREHGREREEASRVATCYFLIYLPRERWRKKEWSRWISSIDTLLRNGIDRCYRFWTKKSRNIFKSYKREIVRLKSPIKLQKENSTIVWETKRDRRRIVITLYIAQWGVEI